MATMTAQDTYVFIDDNTVDAIELVIEARGGGQVSLDIPKPNCPADKLDNVLQMLAQKSAPLIRSAIKKRFGTTSYRIVDSRPTTMPADVVIGQFNATTRKDN